MDVNGVSSEAASQKQLRRQSLELSLPVTFPYFGSLQCHYEKCRESLENPTKEALIENRTQKFWMESSILNVLFNKEISQLKKEDFDRCYVFTTQTWPWLTLHGIDKNNHVVHPVDRFTMIKGFLWTKRKKYQLESMNKFNPLKKKVLFIPVNQDKHWSLIVVENPWKAIERLIDVDPPTEVFDMTPYPETIGENTVPEDHMVTVEDAEKAGIPMDERLDPNQQPLIPPSPDDPVIYSLCSMRKLNWVANCELVNEVLTALFLDESNPSLKDVQEELKEDGLVVDGQIVNGRRPKKLICSRSDCDKRNCSWPCAECLNNGPHTFKKMLPFRYARINAPQQFNDFDCGIFMVYYMKRWFDRKRPTMDQDVENWFGPEDIFNYRYEARRYLDSMANEHDREPVNVFGTAKENGYMETTEESLTYWRALKFPHLMDGETANADSEKTKKVIDEMEEEASTSAEVSPIHFSPSAEVELELLPKPTSPVKSKRRSNERKAKEEGMKYALEVHRTLNSRPSRRSTRRSIAAVSTSSTPLRIPKKVTPPKRVVRKRSPVKTSESSGADSDVDQLVGAVQGLDPYTNFLQWIGCVKNSHLLNIDAKDPEGSTKKKLPK